MSEQAERQGNVIPIHSKRDAIEWGERWMETHRRLYANCQRVIDEYEHRLLMARTDLLLEQCERLLERIAHEDEIKRFRAMLGDTC